MVWPGLWKKGEKSDTATTNPILLPGLDLFTLLLPCCSAFSTFLPCCGHLPPAFLKHRLTWTSGCLWVHWRQPPFWWAHRTHRWRMLYNSHKAAAADVVAIRAWEEVRIGASVLPKEAKTTFHPASKKKMVHQAILVLFKIIKLIPDSYMAWNIRK